MEHRNLKGTWEMPEQEGGLTLRCCTQRSEAPHLCGLELPPVPYAGWDNCPGTLLSWLLGLCLQPYRCSAPSASQHQVFLSLRVLVPIPVMSLRPLPEHWLGRGWPPLLSRPSAHLACRALNTVDLGVSGLSGTLHPSMRTCAAFPVKDPHLIQPFREVLRVP